MSSRSALGEMLTYWEGVEDGPIKDEEVAKLRRALEVPEPLSDEHWAEYFRRLEGPEGCDFSEDTWRCGGGRDKSKSEAILRTMGMSDVGVEVVHRVVDSLGGHCDCEILLNAAERILPDWGAFTEATNKLTEGPPGTRLLALFDRYEGSFRVEVATEAAWSAEIKLVVADESGVARHLTFDVSGRNSFEEAAEVALDAVVRWLGEEGNEALPARYWH